ncbi:hypothetical protein [uncultured Winogradskyella sp.]|uniref:hypothetical protein n=1 Tax=uncultured Winogradskyella sp. TaxID=395353 RepID=UPI00351705CA
MSGKENNTKKKELNRTKVKAVPYNPNITEDDFFAIGKKGLSLKREDDILLLRRKETNDFTGNDLDVPKPNRSDKKATSLRDEENSLYGQGGETKEHLEEPRRANLPPEKKGN